MLLGVIRDFASFRSDGKHSATGGFFFFFFKGVYSGFIMIQIEAGLTLTLIFSAE